MKIRWGAAIVGGFLAGLLFSILLSWAFGAGGWTLLVGWLLFGFWFGRSGPYAWPRTWLVMAIQSFAMPIAALALSGRVTAETMATAANEAEQAGAALGGVIGGTLVTGAAGFLGFFLGIIFALLAYFGHRNAKQQAA